jgi:hypothetical protein
MEKYKNRAKEIFLKTNYTRGGYTDLELNNALNAMCELAEEVEKPIITSINNMILYFSHGGNGINYWGLDNEYVKSREVISNILEMLNDLKKKNNLPTVYTKQEVEEILQKQRELCVKKAKPEFNDNCGGYSKYPQIKLTKRYIHTAIITVDEDSILNAKLKF